MTEIATSAPLYINFSSGLMFVIVVGLCLQVAVIVAKKLKR
jgi:hypothetical protein